MFGFSLLHCIGDRSEKFVFFEIEAYAYSL